MTTWSSYGNEGLARLSRRCCDDTPQVRLRLPAERQRMAFSEARRGLHPDHGPLMQLGKR